MPTSAPIFTPDTFRFFRELARNNHKPWMDANRQRYRRCVVGPLRTLLDRLAPFLQDLDPQFDVTGRPGVNFSRINRDIRFAADKTPYRAHMYLTISSQGADGDGQLYVGISADTVTAGFRIYYQSRESRLAQVGIPRARANPKWLERQARGRRKKYESYWYTSEKGQWTKRDGWPVHPEQWKRLKGWIVRRKMKPAAAARPDFVAEVRKIFREVFPLYQFMSRAAWKS